MDDTQTTPQMEPVTTTVVETTQQGIETTTYENDVRVSLRIDYSEAYNLYASTRIQYYDEAGFQTGYDETHRDGTTYIVRESLPDGDGIITRSQQQTDPLNVHFWTELSYVERYLVDPSDPINRTLLSYKSSEIHDTGGSASYSFEAGNGFASFEATDAGSGVSTTNFYALDTINDSDRIPIRQTIVDLGNTQDFASKDIVYSSGIVAKLKVVGDDGESVTTDYANGIRTLETTRPDGASGEVGTARTFAADGETVIEQSTTEANGTVTKTGFVDSMAATRTILDGGDIRSWASHVATLGPDGRPVSATTVNDDGSTAAAWYTDGVRSSAVVDRDGPAGHIVSTLTFNATGALSQNVTTAATGLVTKTAYFSGTITSREFADGGGDFDWATHINRYDASGIRISAYTINDDATTALTEFTNGIRSRQSIDRDESRGGMDSERTFDASGTLAGTKWTTADGIEVATVYDAGRPAVRTALDLADAFEFDTHSQTYRDGKVSASTTTFDNGLLRDLTYADGVLTLRAFTDGGNDFGWQSRQFALDDRGDVTGVHTIWDDASVTDTGSFL